MSTLYLNTQGAVLRKEEHRFLVVKNKEVILSVPDFKVERILIYGHVQVTTQAMRFAMKNNIPITFLTMYGRFIGSTLPAFSKNILLRISQFDKLSDKSKKISLSKKVIRSKITNSISMLKRFFRSEKEEITGLEEIKMNARRLENANSINAIRGIEGIVSSIYFSNIRKLLEPYIEFHGRNYHPAKDPFNSLLNFLYSLVANEMLGIIYAKGLDPYYGFLHAVEYGRVSLVFDLIEPFRASIADSLAVKMFKKFTLTKNDFEKHNIYGFVLKSEKRKIVLANYEMQMEKEFSYNGKRTNFRKAIMEQLESFSSYINGEGDFKPFTILK